MARAELRVPGRQYVPHRRRIILILLDTRAQTQPLPALGILDTDRGLPVPLRRCIDASNDHDDDLASPMSIYAGLRQLPSAGA